MIQRDQEWLASLVPAGAKVLDIGCGAGEFLAYLEQEKHVHGQGIEIAHDEVKAAVKQGLSVIHGDADSDLIHYPDHAFDVAVIQRSIQAMQNPRLVLEQALRIAQRVILVIPNFGHWQTRWYLFRYGRMPVTSALSYQWYETPNIHFCTIKDMVVLAEEMGCIIEARYCMDSKGVTKPFSGYGSFRANLFADYGVFILRI